MRTLGIAVLAAFKAVALATVMTQVAMAEQAWPTQPVTIEIGFSGGTADVVARLIGESLQQDLGQPAVIDPRDGAGGYIAASHVARSAADGYTLLLGTNALTMNKAMGSTPNFEPAKDLQPLAPVLEMPFVLVTASEQPYDSVPELIQAINDSPKRTVFSSNGVGSGPHFAAELLMKYSGLKATHIPYKGGSTQLTALLSKEVTFSFITPALALPQIAAGKLKALAITSHEPISQLPGVPTLSSLYPGYPNVTSWFGLFAPPGVDESIRLRLQQSLWRLQDSERFKQQIGEWGAQSTKQTGPQFTQRLVEEQALWTSLVNDLGIKPN